MGTARLIAENRQSMTRSTNTRNSARQNAGAANQCRDRQTHQTALAKMRVPPIRLRIEPVTKRDAADDRAEIKKARRHRWHPKNMFRVEHSHYQRGQRHQKDEREHDAREQNSELRFLDGKTGRENIDENRSEDDAEQRDRAHKNERESGDLTRKIPRRLVALGSDSLGESRNECGRESAFRKEIAQHIRRAEGSQKRVHISRRAEERGENNFADETENTAAKNCHADNSGRARAYSLSWHVSHRRTKNNVRKFTKGKTSNRLLAD